QAASHPHFSVIFRRVTDFPRETSRAIVRNVVGDNLVAFDLVLRNGYGKTRARVTFLGAAGGGGRNRTGVHGFAGRCMTTLPPRRVGSRTGRRLRDGTN